MRRTKFDRVRIYQTLRSAHLERARQLPPSSILYRSKRYDFDPELAVGLDLIAVGTLRMAFLLATSNVRAVEINEPLMRAGLRRTVVALATLQAAARLRRRPLTVVSYAIENRNPFISLERTSRRQGAVNRLDRRLSKFATRHLNRIVYGTDAARALYESIMLEELAAAVAVTIPALPGACRFAGEPPKEPNLVLFLGALVERKGFDRLIDAWPDIRACDSGIALQIVGKGAMENAAVRLSEQEGNVAVRIDPPRAEIHLHLARAKVLVLLSQPAKQWREQVGLPIVEGLAHGCVIVTTTETGLAQWLSMNGHEVIAPDSDREQVIDAVVRAVRSRSRASEIRASLPEIDGRLAADAWLFGDTG